MPWLLTFAYSYLLGSIPFGYILVRVFRKEDVRATGSGNIGATNVARSSKGLGIATLVLDALKGWLAVILTRNILVPALHIGKPSPAMELAAFAALAAILGHMFPIWLGFRGGKGVATALGVFIALSWPSALAALGIFLVVFVLTRYVSLASIVAAIALPVFVWILTPNRSLVFMLFTVAISLLVIFKHHANIARLRSGTESKFGSNKVEGSRA